MNSFSDVFWMHETTQRAILQYLLDITHVDGRKNAIQDVKVSYGRFRHEWVKLYKYHIHRISRVRFLCLPLPSSGYNYLHTTGQLWTLGISSQGTQGTLEPEFSQFPIHDGSNTGFLLSWLFPGAEPLDPAPLCSFPGFS